MGVGCVVCDGNLLVMEETTTFLISSNVTTISTTISTVRSTLVNSRNYSQTS